MNLNITPIRTDRSKLDFTSPSIFCEDFLNSKTDNKIFMSGRHKEGFI